LLKVKEPLTAEDKGSVEDVEIGPEITDCAPINLNF